MDSAPGNSTGSDAPAAVVVGGDLNGLGVSRSLAEGGVRTYVIERRRLRPAVWSRHATRVGVKAHRGPQLVEALHRLAQGLAHPPLLIIADELALLTISESREELRHEYRFQLPQHDTVEALQNKARFHEFAIANGLPVPRGVVIRNLDDIKHIHGLNLPVVIKPADKRFVHEGVARRLVVASDWRRAERVSRKLIETAGEIIVQEQVGGPESCIYFTLFYSGVDRLPYMFTGRKLGDKRPRMDSTAFCTGASPHMTKKLEELTRCFIERTGYAGFGSVEYKVDPQTGELLIIEPTVGRTDWQEEIATLSGVNLPLAAYCQEFGLPYQPAPREDRVIWQASWVDRLKVGVPPLCAKVTVVDGYWRGDDPLPAIVHYPGNFIVSSRSILLAMMHRAARRANRVLDRASIRAPLRVAGAGIVAVLCLGWATSSHFDGLVSSAADLSAPDGDRINLSRPADMATLPVAVAPPLATSAPAESPVQNGETFEIGDKLKIILYEHVRDTEKNKWARAGAPPLGFEERSEFTGEYTVGDGGSLSIPLLGSIRAARLTSQQLESELAKAFKSLTGQEAMVSISSVARPGVFVLGPVKNPGSYAYMPGMTVLHAMALAGGLENGGNSTWERVQAVQEYGRRGDAAEDLPALMARVAVLEAERDGGPPRPSSHLLDLVGDFKARQLVANEEQRRAALQAAHRTEEDGLANSLQAAKQLVQSASGSLGLMDDLIKMRMQRVEGVKTLATTGNVNGVFLLQAQSDLVDAQQRRQDAAEKYTDAQQRVRQIEGEQARLRADEKTNLDTSIGTLEQQITSGEREIASSNRVLGALNLSSREPQIRQASAGGGSSSFEIVRRSPTGPVSLPANEMTPLRPGDLVRITAGTRPMFDGGGSSSPFIKTQAVEPGSSTTAIAGSEVEK